MRESEGANWWIWRLVLAKGFDPVVIGRTWTVEDVRVANVLLDFEAEIQRDARENPKPSMP